MNNVKILCIAGSIVLGSILLSGQAFGKALIMTVSQIQLTILSRGLSLFILIIPKPFH